MGARLPTLNFASIVCLERNRGQSSAGVLTSQMKCMITSIQIVGGPPELLVWEVIAILSHLLMTTPDTLGLSA